jgi:hypothetical protein
MVALLLLFITVDGMVVGEAATDGQAVTQVQVAGQKDESAGLAISQDRAVQIAREMFPELLEGKDVDVQLNDYYLGSGSEVWHLRWDDSDFLGRRTEHFDIGIDAVTGALANLFCSNNTAGLEGSAVPLTKDAARQKAEEYAKKYRPAEFSHTSPAKYDLYGFYPRAIMRNIYTFSWERMESGIPVKGDGINVGVDLFSGRLIGFSVIWHREAIFTQLEAQTEGLDNKILKELGLILCYQVAEGNKANLSSIPEARLVYQLNSPDMLKISPVSGEALTSEGKAIPLNQYKRFSSLPVPVTSSSLEGIGSFHQSAQKVSQAEAQKAAQEFFRKIGIDKEVVRNGGGSSRGGVFNEETWNYSLEEDLNRKPGQQHKQIDVGIDTFTGEVRKYNIFTESAGHGQKDDSTKKITWDTAREKAVNFIRLIAPEKLGQLVEEEQQKGNPELQEGYIFNFVRLVNGIPFLRDGIMICVSAGEITSYNCNWHTVKFPSATGLITREEAEKIFQAKLSLQPVYIFTLEGENSRRGKVPALALMFDRHHDMGIDARTGQLVEVGLLAAQPEEKPGDVIPPGHWAAIPLSLLADSGLLPAEGFNPEGAVSRRDAVRVLMSTVEVNYNYEPYQQAGDKASFTDVSPSDPDYVTIQSAVRRGVLVSGDLFSPEQPVLREELAVWLVRALGYSEVAEMPAAIELKAADAGQMSEKARNYVAIAWGLGLIKGDENNLFRPADQVTWAELASLVTRAAPRLRSVRQW